MRIWDKFFGNYTRKKPDKSLYLQSKEDPLDITFVKNFTSKGGLFLFCESAKSTLDNFKKICIENNWEDPTAILCLDESLGSYFDIKLSNQSLGNLKSFKAVVLYCEYIISNTGKILLSEHQIKHFKIPNLPETVIIVAKSNQLVKDVSHGMTLLKNKYGKEIPTNISTLNVKSNSTKEKITSELETSAKNIYLLLED